MCQRFFTACYTMCRAKSADCQLIMLFISAIFCANMARKHSCVFHLPHQNMSTWICVEVIRMFEYLRALWQGSSRESLPGGTVHLKIIAT